MCDITMIKLKRDFKKYLYNPSKRKKVRFHDFQTEFIKVVYFILFLLLSIDVTIIIPVILNANF